jgi:hypothetical protein
VRQGRGPCLRNLRRGCRHRVSAERRAHPYQANIVAFRTAYPAALSFEMHRTIGLGEVWVNEYTIRYDGKDPHSVVGIMEFGDDQVVRERIYINQPWDPPSWRGQWVEMMTDPTAT